MHSRDIVLQSLSFAGAPRLPMTLPAPYPNDVIIASASEAPQWKQAEQPAPFTPGLCGGSCWRDEWGNLWARLNDSSAGEVIAGALGEWEQLDSYVMPRFDDPDRYRKARACFAEHGGRYRIGLLPGFPFSIMRCLRRMDIFLADLLLYPRQVRALAERVVELLVACMDNWSRAGADAVMFCEDWGTQERLLVSPALWREMFKPDFALLCGAARERGLATWMHSCGYIWDIIPDLIECGIAVLQLDQPALLGVERLAHNFGGQVHFWCPVDIQKVLPTGNLELIDSFACQLMDKLGGFGRAGGFAGFIAGYYGANEAIAIRPEWQDRACRAFVRHGSARRLQVT